MPLNEAEKANFETLQGAFEDGNVALLETTRIDDGSRAVLLCAIGYVDEEYLFTPFAEMVDGNPYEIYTPPA